MTGNTKPDEPTEAVKVTSPVPNNRDNVRDPVAVSKAKKITISLVAAPLVIIALIVAAWGIDTWRNGDNVARGVTVAGKDVGGNTKAELTASLDELAETLPSTKVEIEAEGTTMETTAGELGLSLDRDSTSEAVRNIDKDAPIPSRPFRWLASLFSTRDAKVAVKIDGDKLAKTLVAIQGDRRKDPVEPKIEASEDGVKVVPGIVGTAITVKDLVDALPSTLGDVAEPIKISVKTTHTPPQITDAQVESIVAEANKTTEGDLTLEVGSKKLKVPGKEFRPAFKLSIEGKNASLAMDGAAVEKVLTQHSKTAPNPAGVRFDIVNGVPTPVGGTDAQVCCGEEAPKLIVDALLAGKTTIPLPHRVYTAAEGRKWAAGLGVKQIVGSFTTRHPCCQSRVKNIHRISDLTRGILIAPGETFSVNGAVGRRTVANGFFEGGVINEGEHTTDIGGGVSQYATTLFNSAFFAGLDIPEYKAHSEWLSRYPFGREATLWYPSVDLKIRNETPYGVVIWPTYTGTSVTIDLWSTFNVKGEQTAQNPTSGCGKITTTRTRTWTDGRVEKDKFYASYKCG
ncbi:MAG TPA: VanW family protein [Microthrixaceae bacterium]|nr:VanW family protein [Microthrixaceae bacterium]